MSQPNAPPTFSVIIPTRDRADLFERSLKSVLAQDIDDLEAIVVNDGSHESQHQRYQALEQAYAGRVSFHHLVRRRKGHGPAYARNHGASHARGRYLCFLDDDDLWTDSAHLRRCRDAIAALGAPLDLYLTDQRAMFEDGRQHPGPLWLSGMDQQVAAKADAHGNRRVTLHDLLRADGFAHLNCSIYRRGLFDSIGGLDETLRYEEDRDIYLRAIDTAEHMLYNPAVIAQHHIPGPGGVDNASVVANRIEKKLFQLRICDKAITSARQAATRDFGRRTKGHTLRHIAQTLRSDGRNPEALLYMREALTVAFSFGWFAFTALCTVQALLAPRRT